MSVVRKRRPTWTGMLMSLPEAERVGGKEAEGGRGGQRPARPKGQRADDDSQ